MGVQILDMLEALESVPKAKKKQAIRFFQSTWNPQELYYIDPLVSEQNRAGDHHTWEHIWAHMSGAAESALQRLGDQPKSRGSKAPFVNLNQVDIGDWIVSLNWENPWMYGEHFSKVVKHYWHRPAYFGEVAGGAGDQEGFRYAGRTRDGRQNRAPDQARLRKHGTRHGRFVQSDQCVSDRR